MNWVSLFVRGVWSPYKAFTDLHFTKLSREGDCQRNVIFSSETKKVIHTFLKRVTGFMFLKYCCREH